MARDAQSVDRPVIDLFAGGYGARLAGSGAVAKVDGRRPNQNARAGSPWCVGVPAFQQATARR
jgi:hypothetical protein